MRYADRQSRIADGQYDDEGWSTIDPELLDAIPRERAERPDPPRRLTPKQRLRIKRNCCVKAAHDRGISQRDLAKVFGLPRSVVGEIVQGKQLCGRPRGNPGEGDSEPD